MFTRAMALKASHRDDRGVLDTAGGEAGHLGCVAEEVLDFSHATEHLSAALRAADGEGTAQHRHRLEALSQEKNR